MRHNWIKKDDNDTLTIFMLGWAADPGMLEGYPSNGSDLLCFYDYNDMTIERQLMQEIAGYPHRRLEAWSFGVWAAGEIFENTCFETARAINGTPIPVNAEYGIHPRNFALTVRGIESTGNEKFIERMCGERIEEYRKYPSRRTIEDISSELRNLAELFGTQPQNKIAWSEAIIGQRDAIFPAAAQQRYWHSTDVPYTVHSDMPHYFR